MRFTDIIITIPVIVIGAVLGRTFGSLGAAVLGVVLGLFAWTDDGAPGARRVPHACASASSWTPRGSPGARDRRIIFRHILPNAIGVIIVNATLLMAGAILLETGAELPRLRRAVARHVARQDHLARTRRRSRTRPWLFWWPGIFIIAIALCVNFIGDGLRDAFDPRQKKMPSERAMRRAGRRGGPVVPILDRTEPKDRTGDGAMEAVYTGDVVNYHDQRPEEPGDAQNEPLNPER